VPAASCCFIALRSESDRSCRTRPSAISPCACTVQPQHAAPPRALHVADSEMHDGACPDVGVLPATAFADARRTLSTPRHGAAALQLPHARSCTQPDPRSPLASVPGAHAATSCDAIRPTAASPCFEPALTLW
jgi:hypothetical protein